jgi:hypothetical protein
VGKKRGCGKEVGCGEEGKNPMIGCQLNIYFLLGLTTTVYTAKLPHTLTEDPLPPPHTHTSLFSLALIFSISISLPLFLSLSSSPSHLRHPMVVGPVTRRVDPRSVCIGGELAGVEHVVSHVYDVRSGGGVVELVETNETTGGRYNRPRSV